MVIWFWLYVNNHVIPISISTHFLLSTKLPIKLLQPSCHYHPHLFCTNLNITYFWTNSNITLHTSVLALSRAEILCILQSQAGLQEKTIYRSALFPSGNNEAKDVLLKKALARAINKVVREIAGWTRLDLTLGTSTSTATRLFLCCKGLSSLYSRSLSSLCNRDTRRSRRYSKQSNRFTQIDSDRWLDQKQLF